MTLQNEIDGMIRAANELAIDLSGVKDCRVLPLTTYLNDGELFIRYESVQALVNERPATAEDFVNTVGASQYALLDPDGDGEAIYQIRVNRICADGKIEVIVIERTRMHRIRTLDADELALRIEAS